MRALRQQMAGVLCSGLFRGRTCWAALCTSCASALLLARHSWTCLLAEVRICLLEARPACLPGEEALQRQGVLREPLRRQLCLCRSTFVVRRLASKCQCASPD